MNSAQILTVDEARSIGLHLLEQDNRAPVLNTTVNMASASQSPECEVFVHLIATQTIHVSGMWHRLVARTTTEIAHPD